MSEIHINCNNSISVKFLRWVKIYFASSSLKKLINVAYDTAKNYTKSDLFIIIRMNTSSSYRIEHEHFTGKLLHDNKRNTTEEIIEEVEADSLNKLHSNNVTAEKDVWSTKPKVTPSHSVSINAWGYLNTCAKVNQKYVENKNNYENDDSQGNCGSNTTTHNQDVDVSNGSEMACSSYPGTREQLNVYHGLPNKSRNNKRGLVFFPESKENVSIILNSHSKSTGTTSSPEISQRPKSTCFVYNTKLKRYQKFYLNDIKNCIKEQKLEDLNMDLDLHNNNNKNEENAFVLVPKTVYDKLWLNNSPINLDKGTGEGDSEALGERGSEISSQSTNADHQRSAELKLLQNLDALTEMTFAPKRIKLIKKIAQEMMLCKQLTFKQDGRIFRINSFPDSFSPMLKNNKEWKNESQIKSEIISTLEFLNRISLRPNYFSNNKKLKTKKSCTLNKNFKAFEHNNIKLFKLVAEAFSP